jgi:hypothetical protein
MFGSEFKYFIGKSFRFLLLILFLGYYSSITFFTHSHIINGVTIVHSHPFNSDRGGHPSNSPHSEKQLFVIQLLSEFFTTAVAISIAALVLRSLLNEIPVKSTEDGYAEAGCYCTYSLRAPPFETLYPGLA